MSAVAAGRGRRLLVAGEAFDDLVFSALARLPGPGEEVKTDRFAATIGGGAVITAVAAARQGVRVELVSALSAAAVARLRRERLVVRNLRRAGEPGAVTAALSTPADRSFVTYTGVNAVLEPRLARAVAALATRRPARARPGHVHLALSPRDCAGWARRVRRLRAHGVTSSWDFGWNPELAGRRGFDALVDALDFVFVNEKEAALYLGRPSRWLARQAIVVVKRGPRGAAWTTPRGGLHVAARPVKRVVDTTGAGDAFNGAFLAAWLAGRSPRQCLAAGNAAGAACTRRMGGL